MKRVLIAALAAVLTVSAFTGAAVLTGRFKNSVVPVAHAIPMSTTISLPSASEYSEITSTYITNNVYMAVRGDIDVETQWDDIVAEWFAMGGDVLTQEANEWWDSVNG